MTVKLEDLKDEMGSKASMLIQSNLSDTLIEMNSADVETRDNAKLKINFVKFLVNITEGDLNVRLDVDRTCAAFLNR